MTQVLNPDVIKALSQLESFALVMILLLITIPAFFILFLRMQNGQRKDSQARDTAEGKIQDSLINLFTSLNSNIQAQTAALQSQSEILKTGLTGIPGTVGQQLVLTINDLVIPSMRGLSEDLGEIDNRMNSTAETHLTSVQKIIDQTGELKADLLKQFEALPVLIRGELAAILSKLETLTELAEENKRAGDRIVSDIAETKRDLVGAIQKLAPAPAPKPATGPLISPPASSGSNGSSGPVAAIQNSSEIPGTASNKADKPAA